MQQRVEEKVWFGDMLHVVNALQTLGPRLSVDRMEDLMSFAFVQNLQHGYLCMNAYDRTQEQDNMKASIRLLKEETYIVANIFSEFSFSPCVLQR